MKSMIGLIWRVTLLSLIGTAWAQDGSIEARGRDLDWTMRTTGDWVGGSYYDLQSIVENLPDGPMRRIYQVLTQQSKGIDAYLMHYTDVTQLADGQGAGFNTFTMTEIDIVYVEMGVQQQYADEEWFWKSMFETTAEIVESENEGANAALTSFYTYTVGGYNAYEGTIKITMPDNSVKYEVGVLVDLGTSIHNLKLKVDSTRVQERVDEFRTMLRTMRYGGN